MASKTEVLSVIEELLLTTDGIKLGVEDALISGIIHDVNKAKTRSYLAQKGIVVGFEADAVSFSRVGYNGNFGDSTSEESKVQTPKAMEKSPRVKRASHTYIAPIHIEKRVVDLLLDETPHNIWLTGPTGSGKTEFVHHVGSNINRKIFQINGKRDMETAGFFGDRTVVIDEATGQNKIVYKDGPVINAMHEGLDENGNETGEAGILFIDEMASLPSHILIGLNRLLETRKPRREIALDGDGGRVVKSHSQFRIICAANTVGRGLTGNSMSGGLYTAQADAIDISTLNRFSATFKFGYSKKAERNILDEKIGNDKIVNEVIKFRDQIRGRIKNDEASSPFSTRDIVAIGDLYRVLKSVPEAIYYSTMCRLPSDEMQLYNEIYMGLTGDDIIRDIEDNGDMDYLD